MDRDQPLSQELRDDLLNLETLNRVFGSHSLVCKSVKPWLQTGRPNRILDLATGGGDIPRELVKVARRAGIEIEIDAVDRQPSTLEFARSQSKDFPEIRFQQGDIFAFGNGITWDIVLCSLALHHFSNLRVLTGQNAIMKPNLEFPDMWCYITASRFGETMGRGSVGNFANRRCGLGQRTR